MKKIDEKLLETILNEYEYIDKNELVSSEDIVLDDMQEQFVRGYLCAKQKEDKDYEADREKVRQQILQVRSKYCEPILELLFVEGELYHGELAERLELSPSGLNAIIKKMMEGTMPIIEMMQIGKYKIYTLPDAVRKYMESKSQSGSYEGVKGEEEERRADPLISLQHFVKKVGKEWEDTLHNLLRGRDEEISEEIKQSFRGLMDQIKQAEKYDRDSYDELREIIENDILLRLLNKYIEELKECDLIMEEIRQRENGARLARHFKMF